jgi:hypothetical protein
MRTEETEIIEFLKQFDNRYVSITDIAKSIGARKNLNEDRAKAESILRRMELEGWLEANPFEEYRVKVDTQQFRKALEKPGLSLGDTTIISFSDVNDRRGGAA